MPNVIGLLTEQIQACCFSRETFSESPPSVDHDNVDEFTDRFDQKEVIGIKGIFAKQCFPNGMVMVSGLSLLQIGKLKNIQRRLKAKIYNWAHRVQLQSTHNSVWMNVMLYELFIDNVANFPSLVPTFVHKVDPHVSPNRIVILNPSKIWNELRIGEGPVVRSEGVNSQNQFFSPAFRGVDQSIFRERCMFQLCMITPSLPLPRGVVTS
jgi:hypothetical protein